MPQLILVRHGNTFEADQTPTFVGGRTDMKLTATGEAQGQAIADMIAVSFMPVTQIVTGPLIRTRRFAELISQATRAPTQVDDRLKEVDYGLWENKSTEEVKALYGNEIVENWETRGLWPSEMNWSPDEETLTGNIRSLLTAQHEALTQRETGNSVIVTSNGILRFVYRLITGANPDKQAKVKTGAYCALTPSVDGWKIAVWNKRPD